MIGPLPPRGEDRELFIWPKWRCDRRTEPRRRAYRKCPLFSSRSRQSRLGSMARQSYGRRNGLRFGPSVEPLDRWGSIDHRACPSSPCRFRRHCDHMKSSRPFFRISRKGPPPPALGKPMQRLCCPPRLSAWGCKPLNEASRRGPRARPRNPAETWRLRLRPEVIRFGQGVVSVHFRSSRIRALARIRSLRITAVIATLAGFPALQSAW